MDTHRSRWMLPLVGASQCQPAQVGRGWGSGKHAVHDNTAPGSQFVAHEHHRFDQVRYASHAFRHGCLLLALPGSTHSVRSNGTVVVRTCNLLKN